MSTPTCSYKIREAWGAERYCLNSAAWLVEWTTPDDGKEMRHRALTHRCYWHCDEKFLPKGATQITTSALCKRCGGSTLRAALSSECAHWHSDVLDPITPRQP